MTHLLSAKNLTLLRGETCLFRDQVLALDRGELLQIEGPNGSGKTSLLRVLAGLLEPESGEVIWQGQNIRKEPQAFRAAISWLSHRAGLKGDLTPVENLNFESGLRASHRLSIADALERTGVSVASGLPVRSLSAGQQRRVGLARLLRSDTVLWMLDEPLTNLDTDGQQLVESLINEHLEQGGACIVASHQALGNLAVTRSVAL